MARKPNYGIDAPGVIRNLALSGLVFLLIALLFPRVQIGPILFITNPGFLWPAGSLLLGAILMLVYALHGKFRHRDRMLAKIAWRGALVETQRRW